MTRLDEASDDVYLSSGQKLEELLNSVDYDVWKCPNCGMHTLHRYNRWLSKPCPKCGFRTLINTRELLAAPTYTSSGRERMSRDCRHCQYHDEQIIVVPMLVQSSSRPDSTADSSFDSSTLSSFDHGSERNSSSDFGGGSSSGGGASGKW